MPRGGNDTTLASIDEGSGGVSVMLSVDDGSSAAFGTKGDPNGISQRLKKWRWSFELYLTGKGVTDDKQKIALLLHGAGINVQEIYFTLVNEEGSATFEETMKVLDDYFVPKSNEAFERHLFRQIAQASDETVDQFVYKLRQRAASCDFGVREDDYIRDQVIDKCYSSHLRSKFLEQEGSVTLKCLLKIAKAQVAVCRQLREMEQNSNQGHVNAVGGKNSAGAWNARGTRNVSGAWNARGTKGGKKPQFVLVAAGRDIS